jgi:hypothetical protein
MLQVQVCRLIRTFKRKMWENGFAAILAWGEGVCNQCFRKKSKVRMLKVKALRFSFAAAT